MGLAVSSAFANESMRDAAGEPLGYEAIESSDYSYAEERGMTSSAIPPSVDESGTVRSPTSLDEDYDVADAYDQELSAPAVAASSAAAPGSPVADLERSFERFDANNDEMIGPQEAKVDPALDAAFESADRNNSNWLDREEFAAAAGSPARGADELFSSYDANRDGMISWQEAQADPALARWFAQADADRNTALTRSEFGTAVALSASG
jgi:Ca2+-binding EF-hand superfamily protein